MTLLELSETIEQDPTLPGREILRGNIVRYANAALRAIAGRRRRPMRKGLLVRFGDIFVPEEGEIITLSRVWASFSGFRNDLPYLNSEVGIRTNELVMANPSRLCAWNIHNEDDVDGIRLYVASNSGVYQITEATEGLEQAQIGYEGVVLVPMKETAPNATIPLRNPDVLGAMLLLIKSYLFQDLGDIERSNVNYRLFEQRLSAETTSLRTDYAVQPDSFLRS